MIKTETRWICDGCGKDITALCSRVRTFCLIKELSYWVPNALEFCTECDQSFEQWLQSRKKKNPGDEMTHRDQL